MNIDPVDILSERRAGVLLHPTSLPQGTLDEHALRWLDFLAQAGISVWQTLPLGVPQAGRSPYQCDSAFALNPSLLPCGEASTIDVDDFRNWQQQQQFWLHDYAQFAVLKKHFENTPWYTWPSAYKDREPDALAAFSQTNADALLAIQYEQYRLHTRWQAVRLAARERGIYLFGDVPIFVAHDSADVWARRHEFLLDDAGQPSVVAGVPPDYFSETGQRWGNPHYHWTVHQASGFDWWQHRLAAQFDGFDIVRIDHFRGLEAVWEIQRDCDTAIEGRWQKVPGAALLDTLSERFDRLPLVAEDLGIITPKVVALRHQFKLPGMAVLQFSFDHFDDNPHKPKNIPQDCVVYTGTHDNDTSVGWFETLDNDMQAHVLDVLARKDAGAQQVAEALIMQALHSRANLAVVPLQDLLGLGSDARMNVPGTASDNWLWQYTPEQLTPTLAHTLRMKVSDTGRLRT